MTEQLALRRITAPFDGYVEHMLRVSSTCLVVLDRNRYSVPAAFAGRAVSVRSTATEVRIVADGAVIAEHARRFGRDQLICDPWHYLPILERKPGALRNGVPFLDWDLPTSIRLVRDRILKQPKGDRAFVELLLMAREVGLEPLQVACELVLDGTVVTASVVMNEMRRLRRAGTTDHAERARHAEAPDRTARRLRPLRPFARGEPCRPLNPPGIDRLAQLNALHLYGMATAWSELLAEGPRRPVQPEAWLDRLIEAELADRQVRSLRYQLKAARFPVHRDLTGIDWTETPLPHAQIEQLASAAFMETAHNLILVGGTGHREDSPGDGFGGGRHPSGQTRALL